MAKKRKLRPSQVEAEPEQQQHPECQPEEYHPQYEAEPPHLEQEQEQVEEEQEQAENMDQGENESNGDDEGDEEEEEEEEEAEEGGDGEAAVNGSNNVAATEQAPNAVNEEEEEEEYEEEPVEKLLEPFGKEQLVLLVKEAVANHPDLMESVQKLADADPAHRKIFVHGLGWDTTSETLISVFGKYGEIEDCKAVVDKITGKSKGYAFILFKHRVGAKKALQQPQKKIGDRLTSCQLASAGPVPAPPPNAPPVSEYTQRKIFVTNVSAEVDPKKLVEFFSLFGEIEEGPLGIDKQTGKFKGFCLFVYKSIEGAKKALEEPHKTFEGATLHCQKAVDGPKHSKPFHQQQQYHPQGFRKDKSKYSANHGGGAGHLMAPSGPSVSFNPAVAASGGLAPALGQALTALLAGQGAGLGINNLLGGLGGQVNQGLQPGMNYQGYNQPGGNYGAQQGGYQNPQMGGAARPPYMGHGR